MSHSSKVPNQWRSNKVDEVVKTVFNLFHKNKNKACKQAKIEFVHSKRVDCNVYSDLSR